MKSTLSVIAIIILSLTTIVGCSKKNEPGKMDDTTSAMKADSSSATKLDVDSTSKGADVSVNPKEYEFDGKVSSMDKGTKMVTIDHEAIGDYKPAGSNQFKLADSGMAEYVEVNEPKHFTVSVAGDEALIIGMEDADIDDMDNVPGADTSTMKKDTAH